MIFEPFVLNDLDTFYPWLVLKHIGINSYVETYLRNKSIVN